MKIFVAVDVEWVRVAYGSHRILDTPDALKLRIVDALQVMGQEIDVRDVSVMLYDAPKDAGRKREHDRMVEAGFVMRLGSVLWRERQDGSSMPIQKGVDVLLTVDAVRAVMKDGYEMVILLTGDADFIPLLQFCREQGVKTVVIGRETVTMALVKDADIICTFGSA